MAAWLPDRTAGSCAAILSRAGGSYSLRPRTRSRLERLYSAPVVDRRSDCVCPSSPQWCPMSRYHSPEGIGGWLLVYLAGSLPVMAMSAVGFSGWFLDYPATLAVGIFCLLAVPLTLVPLRSPQAPRWNVAVVWIMAVLMVLRAINVFVLPLDGNPPPREEVVSVAKALAGVVSVPVVWALVWTGYFRRSERVRNTFPPFRMTSRAY